MAKTDPVTPPETSAPKVVPTVRLPSLICKVPFSAWGKTYNTGDTVNPSDWVNPKDGSTPASKEDAEIAVQKRVEFGFVAYGIAEE